jgi:hypothetical protein
MPEQLFEDVGRDGCSLTRYKRTLAVPGMGRSRARTSSLQSSTRSPSFVHSIPISISLLSLFIHSYLLRSSILSTCLLSLNTTYHFHIFPSIKMKFTLSLIYISLSLTAVHAEQWLNSTARSLGPRGPFTNTTVRSFHPRAPYLNTSAPLAQRSIGTAPGPLPTATFVRRNQTLPKNGARFVPRNVSVPTNSTKSARFVPRNITLPISTNTTLKRVVRQVVTLSTPVTRSGVRPTFASNSTGAVSSVRLAARQVTSSTTRASTSGVVTSIASSSTRVGTSIASSSTRVGTSSVA